MLKVLKPKDVLVHGHMPNSYFKRFMEDTNLHRYPSLFEITHSNNQGGD